MPRPPWPLVVFDLDGTIVDTVPLIVDSFRHAYRSVVGQEPDVAQVRASIGRPLMDAFRSTHPEHADELFSAYSDWNLANSTRYIRAFPGVPQMLTQLRAAGVQLAIATSKRRSSTELALRLAGLTDLLVIGATLEDTAAHKPHPEPLSRTIGLLGGDPATSVYVGDAVVDILAARAAGASSVGVTWGAGEPGELAAAEPTRIVGDVGALHALLLGS